MTSVERTYTMTPGLFTRLVKRGCKMQCGCGKHNLPDPATVGKYEVYSPSGRTRWMIACWRAAQR